MVKKAAPVVVAVEPEVATTSVNIAEFSRTRDSVIVALATLSASVQDLSRAYINHANTVLGPGQGGINTNLTSILSDSGLLPSASGAGVPGSEDVAVLEGKKKRKRVPHDPLAPKRALTPYFLYMQSARQQIAKELGENAKPKEVADEGTRRWAEMLPAEKSIWDTLYQKNLAIYRVKMAAYKAGEDIPDEATAAAIAEAEKIPAIGEIIEEEIVAPESDDESTPEPVKEPSPPKSKRRKSEKVASPAKETPKSVAKSSKAKKAKKEPSPVPEPASTTKDKKKRTKKT